MATRNERRKRARQRSTVQRDAVDLRGSHSGRMMATVVKAVESRQIGKPDNDDGFLQLYNSDRAMPPPLPLEGLYALYEENAIHSACIDAKVADAVGRGWVLEQADEDAEVDEADQKKQTADVAQKLRDLVRASGVSGGFTAMCRQLAREYDATGWGLWEVDRDGEEIVGIFPVPPHTVRAVKDNRDLFVQIKGAEKVYFKRFGAKDNYTAKEGQKTGETSGDNVANELIVLKHYTPRTQYYGIPPWVSGVPAMAEFTAIREYNVSWFESGGTGDRLIHATADDATVAETIADSIITTMKESRGIGHTTLVTHGTDDTEVNVELLSPEVGKRDGQFGNRRDDLVQEELIAHQVPAYRIGKAVVGELGGEAASEMLDSYRFGVVEPMQEAVEELLLDTIFNPEMGGIDLGGYRFAFKDLDWSQMAEEVTLVESAVKTGMATPNEGRVRLGWEKSDDPTLDEFYVMTGMGAVPLSGAAPEVAEGADVVKEFTKALRAVVDAEQKDGHTLVSATVTGSEQDPDHSVQDEVEAAESEQPGSGRKRRRRGY